VLWLAGLGCLWLPVLDDPPLRSGAYVQDVTTSSAVVAMVTPEPVALTCVVRDPSGSVVATVSDASVRRRHSLAVDGLLPGTSYSFQLRADDGQQVDGGALRTAPAGDEAPVEFAFVGDSGGLPWWIWLQNAPIAYLPARWGWLPAGRAVTAIGRSIASHGPQFVLHLGDVVYPWGRNAQYTDGFFRPFAAVLRNAPMYAVIGNHDQMDCGGLQLLENFRMPHAWLTGDGRCFSFAWGAVRIIGIDCNTDRLGGTLQIGHPAMDYLARELGAATEPWIVVASHFPMRSQSRQRNRGDLLLHLLPLLRESGVSLYLSGHDHCYQRFPGAGDGGDGVPSIVSGGGGKSLYEVRPDPRVVVESAYHWCGVEVHGARMSIRSHRTDGSLIDAVDLRLPAGGELERIRARSPARAMRIERCQ